MIQLSEVVREYRSWRGGTVRALDGVSLSVPAGDALGLIGPNGAGKSTLIQLLLGYLRPTSGTLTLGGVEPRAYVEAAGIGYVPEDVAIPPRWTVRGALETFAALGKLPDPAARVERELHRWELVPLAGRRVGHLSRGNLQRLALAQALLGDRALLILDEPLNGLDPLWVARIRQILAEWRAEDARRTLVVVSHNLAELERTVDRAAVLVDGRIRSVLEVGRPAPAPPPAPDSLEARFLAALGEARP